MLNRNTNRNSNSNRIRKINSVGCLKLVLEFITVVMLQLGISTSIFGYKLENIESRAYLGSNIATSSNESSISLFPGVIAKNDIYAKGKNGSKTGSSFSVSTEFNKGGSLLYSIVSVASPSGIEELIKDESGFSQTSVLLLNKINIKNAYSVNFGFFSHSKLNYDTLTAKEQNDHSVDEGQYLTSMSDTGGVLNIPIIAVPNRFVLATQVWGWYRTGISSLVNSYSTSEIDSKFNRGFMWGVDLGMSISISDFWLPTLVVDVDNISTRCYKNWTARYTGKRVCGAVTTNLDPRDPNSEQVADPTNVKIGVGITPRFSRKVALRIHSAMENIHVSIGDKYLYDPKREAIISTGAELLLGNPFANTPFSVGIAANNKSLSFGASIDARFLVIAFSYISENRSLYVPYSLYDSFSDVKTDEKLVSKYIVGIKFRNF